MKKMISIYEMVRAKRNGLSISEISRELGISRNTIKKYLDIYDEEMKDVPAIQNEEELRALIERIEVRCQYDTSNRGNLKYTKEMDDDLRKILDDEKEKDIFLGKNHKQSLSKKQIAELLISKGYDISEATIKKKINEIRSEHTEAFIRQEYEYGQRLEYDFGEIKLYIDGKFTKVYLAVIASPASNFRWGYLYRNCKMPVFIDSHARFFEMVKGVYKEVVYDNMRNVVKKFIGRNEKELNDELLKMSLYYGFDINVTNTYSGNEKGFVEGSVKFIRKKTFNLRWKFGSFEEAEEYLSEILIELNKDSYIDEEKKHLLPYKYPYEAAIISNNTVDKYSFIHVDKNAYSVPDNLVGKKVMVKLYTNSVIAYYKNEEVAKHTRSYKVKEMCVDIKHYLHTLTIKPGAIKNSLALKSEPELKKIFDLYYKDNPKRFIEILRENKDKSIDEIIELLKPLEANADNIKESIDENLNRQIISLKGLFIGGQENVH